LITGLYFRRVQLLHPERLPKDGPVLYLGLHRNGAVDGFVYRRVLRQPVFLISSQLRRNWFGRLFFAGIAVTRTKDKGDRAVNDEAMRQCLAHLRSGGELFVFPEGTSSLGPRHLPFKSGAAWLWFNYLEQGGPPLLVVPLAIHYTCPWAFRGRAEVVVGEPISMALPDDAGRLERLKLLKRRLRAALEEVGVNFSSCESQEMVQQLACLAAADGRRSYSAALKAMERAVPENISSSWQSLDADLRHAKVWRYEGAPCFPLKSAAGEWLALGAVVPFVAGAMALNLPAYAAGWFAGKKFPDDRNVISLWKILAGVPALTLWMGAVAAVLVVKAKFWWLAAYLAITWLGLQGYAPLKRLAVAVGNDLRYPALRPKFLSFRQTLLQSLPDETE
jgi:1-acyl-sn-glycerol-3-phosphate acyltransferase